MFGDVVECFYGSRGIKVGGFLEGAKRSRDCGPYCISPKMVMLPLETFEFLAN
jgi:hypothetical protein